jgi:hypothetical protein
MIHRNLTIALIAAGSYLGGAFALKAAEHAGFISHATTIRAYAVFTGLALAVYGNYLPKSIGRLRSPVADMRMQSVLRVSGWAFMLGGIGYALTSLFTLSSAIPIALLASATAYVLGYSVWAFMECSSSKQERRPT